MADDFWNVERICKKGRGIQTKSIRRRNGAGVGRVSFVEFKVCIYGRQNLCISAELVTRYQILIQDWSPFPWCLIILKSFRPWIRDLWNLVSYPWRRQNVDKKYELFWYLTDFRYFVVPWIVKQPWWFSVTKISCLCPKIDFWTIYDAFLFLA